MAQDTDVEVTEITKTALNRALIRSNIKDHGICYVLHESQDPPHVGIECLVNATNVLFGTAHAYSLLPAL